MGKVPRSQDHPEGPLPPLSLLFWAFQMALLCSALSFRLTVILWYFPVTVSA